MQPILSNVVPFLLALVLLTYGALLLLSPSRFLQVGSRIGKVMGMSPPEIQLKPGPNLDWRLLGMICIVMGLVSLSDGLSYVSRTASTPAMPRPPAFPIPSWGPTWPSLVFGMLLLSVGAVVLWQPMLLNKWFQWQGHRILRDPNPGQGTFITRVFAILFLLTGFWLLWNK